MVLLLVQRDLFDLVLSGCCWIRAENASCSVGRISQPSVRRGCHQGERGELGERSQGLNTGSNPVGTTTTEPFDPSVLPRTAGLNTLLSNAEQPEAESKPAGDQHGLIVGPHELWWSVSFHRLH